MLLAPVYGISAIFSMAAAECKTGTEFLASTEPKMMASRSRQSPDYGAGSAVMVRSKTLTVCVRMVRSGWNSNASF